MTEERHARRACHKAKKDRTDHRGERGEYDVRRQDRRQNRERGHRHKGLDHEPQAHSFIPEPIKRQVHGKEHGTKTPARCVRN